MPLDRSDSPSLIALVEEGERLQIERRYHEALEVLQNARDLASPSTDCHARVRVWRGMGNSLLVLGRRQEALEAYDESLALATEQGDLAAQARSWNGKGLALRSLDRNQEALLAHEQAFKLASSTDAHARAEAQNGKGDALRMLGRWEEALREYAAALKVGIELDNGFVQANSWSGRGDVLRMLRQHHEALEAHESALRLGERLDDAFIQANAWNSKGDTLREVEQWEEALAAHRMALSLGQRLKDALIQANAWNSMGKVWQELGRLREASRAHEEALHVGAECGENFVRASALVSVGYVLERMCRFDAARKRYEEAVELSRSMGYGLVTIRAQAGLRRLRGTPRASRLGQTDSRPLTRKEKRRGPSERHVEKLSNAGKIREKEERLARIYGKSLVEGLSKDNRERMRQLRSYLPDNRVWTVALICDVRGYTTAFSRTDPEEQHSILDQYLTRGTEIIQQHGAGVDKYMGDAILAFFLPDVLDQPNLQDRANTVTNAARCAMDIVGDKFLRTLFDAFRSQFKDLDERSFGVGVGIASGYAKFGDIGARIRGEYTLIGRPVNVAARVQAEAQAWEVAATRECWNCVERLAVERRLVADDRTPKPHGMKGYEEYALVTIRLS